jgi:hypothetical protein
VQHARKLLEGLEARLTQALAPFQSAPASPASRRR